MKSGVWVRLLGAGLIYLGLASLAISLIDFVSHPYYGPQVAQVWAGLGLTLVVNLALAWVGAAIVSRRPSRRSIVAAIVALVIAETLYSIGSWRHFTASLFYAPDIAGVQIFRLLLLIIALIYLAVTWRRPEFQPQVTVPPTEPGATPHRVVAAKITDGPNWHADLLASLRQTGMQETPRRRVWPWILALLAATLFATLLSDLLGAVIGDTGGRMQLLIWLIFGLVYLPLIGAPLALIRRRTSQARQRSAEMALQKSGAKRPIFYLRSFGLDDQVGRPSILELMSNIQPANPEQAMIRVARRCGPVLAIGRPGERLPALGAARFYVSDDVWQEKVADVATVAQLVVWASGTTQGLEWEITHLVRSLAPEKLILWPHPQLLDLDANEREAQWRGFVDGLGTLFPKPLPKPLGKVQFFAFGKDFTPIPFSVWRPTAKGRLMASLRALLLAKDIVPYDKVHTARARLLRRLIFGTIGGLVAIFALGFAYLFVDYVRPQPPEPLAWNLLGSDLFADESNVTPFSSDQILANLQNTIAQMDGKWFGANWQNEKPGEFPPLKRAAQNYVRPYELAHADAQIEPVFYGRGTSLEYEVRSAAEAQALAQKLQPIRDALNVTAQDWQGISTKTRGYFFPDRMCAIIAARQEIVDAEAGFLTFMVNHPNAWSTARADATSYFLKFTRDTLPMAQALVARRQHGAGALAAALKPPY
ncbi:MAG: hypothetical protein AB1508_02505 [Pseudomonadota bacterium]